MVSHRINLSLTLLASLLMGCNQSSTPESEGSRAVKWTEVQPASFATVRFSGVVEARVRTDLAFQTLGRIITRRVEVGDLVREGDIVAELDPVALQFGVTSAEANLRNAEAHLKNAQLTEWRRKVLASTTAGSVADLDVAELGLMSAEAGVAEAQANLDKARQQLGYAQLKAGFDGVIVGTSAEVGQTVTAGQTIARLARLEQRDVVIDISQTSNGELPLNTRFDVALQLDPSIQTSGVLREIGPEADANTRTHRLKIAIDGAPDVYRLGSIVSATAVGTSTENAMELPGAAIVASNRDLSVWVIEPTSHSVSLRQVQIAKSSSGSGVVRVLSGLKPGEKVVVAGVNELRDGQIVKLEEEAGL